MIVGFNSDIKYRDETFHIQTEDKGDGNPTIETLVYHKGEILLSRRLSYSQFLKAENLKKKVRSMMKTQHNQIISELKEGKFLNLISLDTQVIDDQSLDDMVITYLSAL